MYGGIIRPIFVLGRAVGQVVAGRIPQPMVHLSMRVHDEHFDRWREWASSHERRISELVP
jgi:hypothetical protein